MSDEKKLIRHGWATMDYQDMTIDELRLEVEKWRKESEVQQDINFAHLQEEFVLKEKLRSLEADFSVYRKTADENLICMKEAKEAAEATLERVTKEKTEALTLLGERTQEVRALEAENDKLRDKLEQAEWDEQTMQGLPQAYREMKERAEAAEAELAIAHKTWRDKLDEIDELKERIKAYEKASLQRTDREARLHRAEARVQELEAQLAKPEDAPDYDECPCGLEWDDCGLHKNENPPAKKPNDAPFCPDCGQLYWDIEHHDKMHKIWREAATNPYYPLKHPTKKPRKKVVEYINGWPREDLP